MLIAKVEQTVRRHGLLEAGSRVLIAFSGGVDSRVLSDVLLRLHKPFGWTLAVAHLNHGLRLEADSDEAFCRSFGEQTGLSFFSKRIDLASDAEKAGRGIEEQGRLARLDFLRTVAEREGFDRVALGHTLDDQAETFLLRLLRGAGSKGLAAVYPNLDDLFVRPLLDTRRSEILKYAEDEKLAYREDESNKDRRFTRNRLRLDTLPHLQAEYNPSLNVSLAQTADILREEDRFLGDLVREHFDSMAESFPGQSVRLPIAALSKVPLALKRRLVREAMTELRGHLRNVGAIHVHDVLELIRPGKSGREAHTPGLRVHRDFDWLVFEPGESRRGEQDRPDEDQDGAWRPCSADSRKARYNGYEYELSIPAHLCIPETGDRLRVESLDEFWSESIPKREDWPPASGKAVVIGVHAELSKLTVRSPRRGDRFRPLGAPGSKSVARYLMERKVSRSRRHRIPVVVDSEDRILWVAGFGVSEASRMGATSRPLRLEWEIQ